MQHVAAHPVQLSMHKNTMTTSESALLRTKINQETATYPWQELQRQFATGQVIAVASELDLVEVAAMMADDRASEFATLLQTGQVAKVSDSQAQLWLEQNAQLWTVVVKPWILVQQRAH